MHESRERVELASMVDGLDDLSVGDHLSIEIKVDPRYYTVPGAKETPCEGTEERFSDSTFCVPVFLTVPGSLLLRCKGVQGGNFADSTERVSESNFAPAVSLGRCRVDTVAA